MLSGSKLMSMAAGVCLVVQFCAMLSDQPSTAGVVLIVLGAIFVVASAGLLVIWHFAWASRPPGLWVPLTMVFGAGVWSVWFGALMRTGLLKKRQQ
jgi:hypothetical protein